MHFDFTDLEAFLTLSRTLNVTHAADNLGQFLLGRGFAFIGQQYRFSIAGRHYYVDLVFYHVILKTYVLIDLKRNEVQHEDIGQMNFYLNYFCNEVCTDGDNAPIGIVWELQPTK